MQTAPANNLEPVSVMLKEYELLRAEVMGTLTHRLQVWSFGAGATGVLLAGALTAISEAQNAMIGTIQIMAGIVMALLVPLLCLAVLHTWLSEVRRGRRASWYLWGLERRVNDSLGSRVLGWQEDLRHSGCEQMRILRSYHVSTILFFSATGFLSASGGAWFLLSHLAGKVSVGSVALHLLAVAWVTGLGALSVEWLRKHKAACRRCEEQEATGWPKPIPSAA
jgi:hypothetical protein